MRFVFNFFFFGFLFFLLSMFFPDTFHTLLSWAQSTYEFFRNFINELTQKYSHKAPESGEATKALLFTLMPRRFF